MGHHADSPFDGEDADRLNAIREIIKGKDQDTEVVKRKLQRALLDTTGFVGATGDHPEGKLTPNDEGSIYFRIGLEGEKVVLDFGTSVHWVGMSAQQAADLASDLLKWARLAGRKKGKTITVNLGAV